MPGIGAQARELRICDRCGSRVAHPDTGLCPSCDPHWPSKKGGDSEKGEYRNYGYE